VISLPNVDLLTTIAVPGVHADADLALAYSANDARSDDAYAGPVYSDEIGIAFDYLEQFGPTTEVP
jgi:hypothetical protein